MSRPAPTGPREVGHALARYGRTVRLLRPAQVTARATLRGKRAVAATFPNATEALLRGVAPPIDGWPTGFVPLDGQLVVPGGALERAADGQVTVLGHTRALGGRAAGATGLDWTQADAPLLWRYHLHYLDWMWEIAAHPDAPAARNAVCGLYASWRAGTAVGRGPAWAPYVVALRAWTLCGLLAALAADDGNGGDASDAGLRDDLGVHQAYLRGSLETDVGGNHLLKNLKAMVGLAVAETGRPHVRHWLTAFTDEASRQCLPDGGHMERAPAYHCQVLGDILDVGALVRAAGEAVPPRLAEIADAMRGWLATVLGPDGSVPLLNDGYPVPARTVDALLSPARRDSPAPDGGADEPAALTLLADSGVAILRAGPWRALADVGKPCPDDLPAHAHADTLAFLLWHGTTPVLVDTGTSTYAAGPVRDAERSTAAHSTVRLDGADSTEVWGAFRAGRRASVRLTAMSSSAAAVVLTAAHDGYRHRLGRPVHERTWSVTPGGVRVTDRITGRGRHLVEVAFHLPPEAEVHVGERQDAEVRKGASEAPPARVTIGRLELALHASAPGLGGWRIRDATRAAGWDRRVPAAAAVYTVETRLPFTLHTRIEQVAVPAPPLVPAVPATTDVPATTAVPAPTHVPAGPEHPHTPIEEQVTHA